MALDDPKLVAAPGFDPVGEDHIRHFIDLGDPNLRNPPIGSQRLGRLAADQVDFRFPVRHAVQERAGPVEDVGVEGTAQAAVGGHHHDDDPLLLAARD